MANGDQPSHVYDPSQNGGQSIQQFLGDRPDEAPAVQPAPGSDLSHTVGGYEEAATKGLLYASPVMAAEALSGVGNVAVVPTAIAAAGGGLIQHAYEQAFPDAPGWQSVAAGSIPGLGVSGAQAGYGLARRYLPQAFSTMPHALGTLGTMAGSMFGLEQHGAQAASYLANHIFQAGMLLAGAPVLGGMLRLATNPTNARSLVYPAASTLAAFGSRYLPDIPNYLAPDPSQNPAYQQGVRQY